jgi:hypothetical protein
MNVNKENIQIKIYHKTLHEPHKLNQTTIKMNFNFERIEFPQFIYYQGFFSFFCVLLILYMHFNFIFFLACRILTLFFEQNYIQ